MLKEEVLNEFYFLSDYLEKEGHVKDLNKYKKDFPLFLLHANHIRAYDFVAPFCEGKKVLDIGCFLGHGERSLEQCAAEIIAIDTDENALEFAGQKNIAPSVQFQKADGRQLPFPHETFDIVIAFHLIEHIPPEEVNKFLREVKRVLKSGGSAFVITPNRKVRLLPFQRPFNPDHYQEFTARRFRKTLKSVFDEVEIKAVRAAAWIEQMEKKRVRKSPYRFYVRDPLWPLLKSLVPTRIKTLLNKLKPRRTKRPQPKNILLHSRNEFNNLFQKFNMNDIFLENRMLDKAMGFFAICKKGNIGGKIWTEPT